MVRKIFQKVSDLFNREFDWPEELLRIPEEHIEFKFNYDADFSENLKSLKKNFNLNDEEIEHLEKSYSLQYLIHSLEFCKYEKGRVAKAYAHIFPPEAKRYFVDVVKYLLKRTEEDREKWDHENNDSQRVFMNLLLGISFEYACKALLLHKNYCINESKDKPIKIVEQRDREQCVGSRTINLELAWYFIVSNKLIELKDEEYSIGNYLLFCRNVQSHVPLLMASRGTYIEKSIELIEKIINEIHIIALSNEEINEFKKMFKGK